MELDTESTTTSVDDKTEDFCENPTRDTLAEGLMCLLKPTIDQLDERVRATRISQVELKQQIEGLADELKKISEAQQCPLDLDVYVRKLMNAKLKVTVVSNILQTAQDRLNKVHVMIAKESARRRALLEPSPSTTPLEASNTSIQ
ncbi:SNAPIN protein homolog [Anabrus simplex]|uniref:SNAPIN protein homolog n=1 Tax=Anabrus simplex TaxID=316456 RepID=UPI0034DCCB62